MVAQTRTPRSTWIDAGLKALAAGGPGAVRVELLAKDLDVTRGRVRPALSQQTGVSRRDARHLGAPEH